MTDSLRGPLGLFGGTFDPVHIGHLRAALEVAEEFGLSKLLLIPAGQPPHKTRGDITPFVHRLEMLRRAVEGEELLEVSDMEGKRSGPSYTLYTLEHFFQKGVETYFILGSEAFLEIQTWKSYKVLFDLSHFLILLRQEEDLGHIARLIRSLGLEVLVEKEGEWTLGSEKKIVCFRPTAFGISGSLIRRLRMMGRSIRYLVPEKVHDYIVENRLYLKE